MILEISCKLIVEHYGKVMQMKWLLTLDERQVHQRSAVSGINVMSIFNKNSLLLSCVTWSSVHIHLILIVSPSPIPNNKPRMLEVNHMNIILLHSSNL